MPCICYVPRQFQGISLTIIKQSNKLLTTYAGNGMKVTLRQLYYRFIAKDLFPDSWIHPQLKTKNHFRNYKKFQAIINDARLAGLIDWDHLEDRTRNVMSYESWDNAQEGIQDASNRYRENFWKDQPEYVEVWVEKDALLGIIEQATQKYKTPYFSCRGYTSQSEVWNAAQRFIRMDKPGYIIHLGDHDPSGVDMTRDMQDRMNLFGANVKLERIALTIKQVKKFNPPPSPAKDTDSRSGAYVAKFGVDSWELDALEPEVLVKLIEEKTVGHVDPDIWQDSFHRQEDERHKIELIASNYDRISTLLKF